MAKTRPTKVQALEARVRELEQQAVCKCHRPPCCECYSPDGLSDALKDALRTGAHGHVMTQEGYPVRLVLDDVRHSSRCSRRQEPVLGLILYPMGHELADYWTRNGVNNSPRQKKNLLPLDLERLNEGFYRYGRDVLKATGLKP